VNPAHLHWGTQRENAAEASARLRYPNARKTHCPKGHEYTEENTILTPRPEGWKDRKCRICANLRGKRRRAKHKEQRLSALRAGQDGYVVVPVEMLEVLADEAESGIHQTIFAPLKRQRHLSIVYQARELLAARPQGVK